MKFTKLQIRALHYSVTFILFSHLFLISGCVNDPVIKYNNMVYIGDSNCRLFDDQPRSAAAKAGVPTDCVIGRTALEVDFIPDVDLAWFSLGTNGAGSIDPEIYGDHLDLLIGETSAIVICVLPSGGESVLSRLEPYREQMRERCIEWIDPIEAGINFDHNDDIHYTNNQAQTAHYYQIVQNITELGF